MKMKTKPLLVAIAVSVALAQQAIAAYTPTVNAGTTVDGETIQGTNALQQMYGTANNTTILSGTQNVYGTANDTIISGGTQMVVYGGVSNRANISSGSLQVNGETNDVIATGGFLSINSGSNGTVDPNTGGKMNRTTLSNGAILENRFGVDTDTIINSGGLLETGSNRDIVWKDTAISNNAVINAGGLQTVDNGGTSNGSTVNVGGTLKVQYYRHDNFPGDPVGLQYGTANNTTVYGTMQNDGGVDNGTVVKSGGIFSVMGSIADNQRAISNNATIESGAKASINENAQANGWTINGSSADYVYLENDSSTINDSTVNSGNLWIKKGTATNTVLNSGQMVNVDGADINTVVNGGSYYLGGVDAATSSNLTVNSGAYANINSGTVTDATINGTMFVNPNTSAPDTISTLQGNVSVNDGGKLTLITGVNTQNADVTLTGSGGLYLASNAAATGTYDFALGAMTMNGGNVYFDQVGGGGSQIGYSSLTLDSLDGSGSFYMNTNLASLQGDFLTVKGQANGDFDVYIADTGVSPTSDSSLQIIQTGGGNADFTLANNGHVVDVGTYQYYGYLHSEVGSQI